MRWQDDVSVVASTAYGDDCKGFDHFVDLQLSQGDGLPFRSVGLLPDEARAVARALCEAADDVERRIDANEGVRGDEDPHVSADVDTLGVAP